IIDLAYASEAAGGGREQCQDAQVVLFQLGEKESQAGDLGVVDEIKLLGRLVLDTSVGQHACTVDQATDRAERCTNLGQCASNGCEIAYINGLVMDDGTDCSDAVKIPAYFAPREDCLILVPDHSRRSAWFGPRLEGALDVGLACQRCQPVRF